MTWDNRPWLARAGVIAMWGWLKTAGKWVVKVAPTALQLWLDAKAAKKGKSA